MTREMEPGARFMPLPPPFAPQDARVPRPSTTSPPAQPIGWMLRHHTSKIMI